jgi:hypothetical protein
MSTARRRNREKKVKGKTLRILHEIFEKCRETQAKRGLANENYGRIEGMLKEIELNVSLEHIFDGKPSFTMDEFEEGITFVICTRLLSEF